MRRNLLRPDTAVGKVKRIDLSGEAMPLVGLGTAHLVWVRVTVRAMVRVRAKVRVRFRVRVNRGAIHPLYCGKLLPSDELAILNVLDKLVGALNVLDGLVGASSYGANVLEVTILAHNDRRYQLSSAFYYAL